MRIKAGGWVAGQYGKKNLTLTIFEFATPLRVSNNNLSSAHYQFLNAYETWYTVNGRNIIFVNIVDGSWYIYLNDSYTMGDFASIKLHQQLLSNSARH